MTTQFATGNIQIAIGSIIMSNNLDVIIEGLNTKSSLYQKTLTFVKETKSILFIFLVIRTNDTSILNHAR